MIIEYGKEVTPEQIKKINNLIKELKSKYRPGDEGRSSCPVCSEDTLRFYLAPGNGHLHAGCKNKCIRIME